MIVGIGTDIVQIERLASALEKVGDRAFTASELAYAGKFRDKNAHLAGRWAAKEALAKALGCGFGAQCSWQEIEVVNDENGKPVIYLSGVTAQTLSAMGGAKVHLSISHEKDYATAFVVLED